MYRNNIDLLLKYSKDGQLSSNHCHLMMFGASGSTGCLNVQHSPVPKMRGGLSTPRQRVKLFLVSYGELLFG